MKWFKKYSWAKLHKKLLENNKLKNGKWNNDLIQDVTPICFTENSLVLSVASAWEMQIKSHLSKLRLDMPLKELIKSQEKTNGKNAVSDKIILCKPRIFPARLGLGSDSGLTV